jgi:hypothetical protein
MFRDPTSIRLPIRMASYLKSDVLLPFKDVAMWGLHRMNLPGFRGIAGGWLSVSCALPIWVGFSPLLEKKVFMG